jgi:lipoprotein NlpD
MLMSLTLAGCNSHQAPVSEQSQRLERTAPMILSSNTSGDRQLVETSRPSRVLSVETRPEIVSSVREALSDAAVSRAAPQQASGVARQPITSSRASREPIAERSPVPVETASASAFNLVSTPVSHLVSAGDTLFSIAFQYDMDFRSLALANGLNPPYTIFVGQQLQLKAAAAIADAAVQAVGEGINSAINAVPVGGESSSSLRQPGAGPDTGQLRWSWPHQGQIATPFQPQLTKGVDISGAVGDPVLAAASGDVVYSGRGIQGTGNLIIIRHSDRYLSAYAHNSVMLVSEGRRVIAGEKIAELGVNPQGMPMLHFEIRQEGEPVDPSLLLPGRPVPQVAR